MLSLYATLFVCWLSTNLDAKVSQGLDCYLNLIGRANFLKAQMKWYAIGGGSLDIFEVGAHVCFSIFGVLPFGTDYQSLP